MKKDDTTVPSADDTTPGTSKAKADRTTTGTPPKSLDMQRVQRGDRISPEMSTAEVWDRAAVDDLLKGRDLKLVEDPDAPGGFVVADVSIAPPAGYKG